MASVASLAAPKLFVPAGHALPGMWRIASAIAHGASANARMPGAAPAAEGRPM